MYEREQLFRSLYENNLNAVLLTAPDGRILAANPAACQLFGRTEEELRRIGRPQIMDETDPRLAAALRERARTRKFRGELTCLRKDGTRFPVEMACSVFEDQNGELRSSIVLQDITERRQADSRQHLTICVLRLLNESVDSMGLVRELLALIKDHAGMDAVGLRVGEGEDFPYYEQNGFADAFLKEEAFLCARGGDGAIVRGEDGRAVLECTCGLVLQGRTDPGMPCFTANGSFWTNESSELLALAPAEDPRTNARNRCIHAGYESVALIPLRSGAEIVGLLQLNARAKGRFTPEQIDFYEGLCASVGIALKQRRVEEALRKSEQLNRVIATNSPDIIFAQDLDLRYTWIINPTAPLTPDLVVGKRDEDLLPPEEAHRLTEFKRRLIATGASERTEILLSPGENPRWYDAIYQPLRDDAGKVVGLISYARDITEQKRAQERAEQQQAELLHVSRLSTLGEMAAEMAHELNQPLSAIMTYGGACLRQARSPKPDMARLIRNQQRILEQALRAREVMERIRTFARRYEPHMDRVTLGEAVMSAVALVRWRIRKKNIMLRLALEHEKVVIRADVVRLGQVLVNILRNAIEAIEQADSPSCVTVETRVCDAEQTQVIVSDTGPGVSDEHLPRLFEPFFTTKPGGLGVGLSISRKIVEMHGGTLEAERNCDGGMTFTMTLPIAPSPGTGND